MLLDGSVSPKQKDTTNISLIRLSSAHLVHLTNTTIFGVECVSISIHAMRFRW